MYIKINKFHHVIKFDESGVMQIRSSPMLLVIDRYIKRV
jgi:hypothetical protein